MDDERERTTDAEDAYRRAMIAAQAGDRTAYEQLLRALLQRARRQVAAQVSDLAAREDIVQNVLVAIHRARHTYRPERRFMPWFNAIVRNATIDWYRARSRTALRELPLEIEHLPDPTERMTTGTIDESLSPEMEQALATLSPTQRQAVELIHLEGLSVAEAAARVGVTTGALKVRAHRGYRALRALLRRRDR